MALDISVLLQVIVWGLIIGSVYTLLATGLNIIFGVMKVVNFAHGELMILGAYLTFWLSTLLGLNPYAALGISVILLLLAGLAIERFGFRPVRGTTKLNEIFLSLALILIIQNGLGFAATPVRPVRIESPYQTSFLTLGFVNFSYDFALTLVFAAGIITGLAMFLTRTKLGRSLRATSQNRLAASIMGIDVRRVDMISFGIGSALAAVAGSLFGILNAFDPYSGTVPAIKAFAIIILGGLGSIPGSIVGGFLYGVTESVAVTVLGGSWRDATAFALLTVILVFKPEGIFGEKAG